MNFKRKHLVFIGVIVAAVVVICLGIIIALKHSPTPIPSNIDQKVSFTIFYPPATQTSIAVQRSTLSYDTSSQGLSYDVLVNGKRVIISQQATPDIFSQNGVYSYKLDQAHEYDSFNTSAGEVALTKPDELSGQTVAWVNSKGTLLLAHAVQSLSESEWKTLFNNMQVVK